MSRPPASRSAKSATARASQLAAALLLLGGTPIGAQTPSRETFAIDYIVTIRAAKPGIAHVRCELSGGEEVLAFRFKAPADRFQHFRGSGTVEHRGDTVEWRPAGPYGHLAYDVHIDHRRGDRGHFDSYASRDWIISRARDLFPPVRLEYTPGKEGARPRSRARLLFRLPERWTSAAAHPASGVGEYVLQTGRILSRPRGWIALGQIESAHQEIDDVMVRIAKAPGSMLPTDDVFSLLADAVPRLRKMFKRMPAEILIVSGGDPMFHGGLSAYQSLFLHGDRPLRTPDKTSPILHELFHVAQPFRAAPDADWIAEGLAEYYSLELQRRSGTLTPTGFAKGLEYFARYGVWGVDLRTQADNAATNNSAPLVMYALDQRIQRETAGKKRLDDVVTALAEGEGAAVDDAAFRAAVRKVSGKRLDKFFGQFVERGEMPRLVEAHAQEPTPAPNN